MLFVVCSKMSAEQGSLILPNQAGRQGGRDKGSLSLPDLILTIPNPKSNP